MKEYKAAVYYAKRYDKGETSVVVALCNLNKPDLKVYDRLAEELDTTTDDPEFDASFHDVLIPQSIVDQIRQDAIDEYLQDVETKEGVQGNKKEAKRFTASISSKTIDDIITRGFLSEASFWRKDYNVIGHYLGRTIFQQVSCGGTVISPRLTASSMR